MFSCPTTDDFFCASIDEMIDLRDPLAVLASRMPRQDRSGSGASVCTQSSRWQGHARLGSLWREDPAPSISQPGRTSACATADDDSLLYLKHAFNESDEDVVERWGETTAWQFFAGQAYFEHRQPCDATTLVKFRKLLGEDGVEELLA